MTRTAFPSAILNRTQLEFLEQIIARYGTVVTYAQIAPYVPTQDELGKRQFVSRLSGAGWLVRIKNGVYQVADLTSLGTATLSRYAIAHILSPDSYVSFEAALQFHGLHDQLMQTATSVALKQHQSVVVQEITYQFVKTAPKFFYGYEQHICGGQPAQIAVAEKALIDMIQLHRSYYTTDRVAEILADVTSELDMPRLHNYLWKANLTTQRIFGFLLDRLGIADDPDLVSRARGGQSASRLTSSSTRYDAKWHLYYDPSIVERYAWP
jgi:predicted transcriptional regulator of viral defense system